MSASTNLLFSTRLVTLLAAGVLTSDCAPSGDESANGDSQPDDTRVELVFVDEPDSSSDETPDAGPSDRPTATPADSLPPAPTAQDEVGGDGLLRFDADGQFVVQVGTYTDAKRAGSRVRELEDLGYPAFATTHPSGSPMRVRIGYFATKADADRFGQRFRRDHGGRYWVDRRGDSSGADEVVSR